MKRLLVLLASVGPALLVACGGGGGGGGFKSGSLVTITTPAVLPTATTGLPMSIQIQATFPNPPGAYYVTGGSLPAGTQLDHFTGIVSGYPREVGHFSWEIAAQDGIEGHLPPGRDASFSEDRRTFSLTVARGTVQILPQIPPSAQYRASYSYNIDVAGGTPPYTFAQSGGTLPAGLTVSTGGVIGNFPTRADEHPYHVDVTVTDALGGQSTRTLDVDVVVLPLFIKTSSLPDASEGFPYTTTIELASTGGGAPFTWEQEPLSAGEVTLASIGMQIEAATGKLMTYLPSGAPPAGLYKFTLSVTDEANQKASRQFTLKVLTSPILSSISPKVALATGPFTATGLKFQPGATLVFNPLGGASAKTITPTFVNATTLTFPTAPTLSTAGPVTVRVVNPDGGWYDLTAAMLYSASTITFGTKGFIPSSLSSFGLDCADTDSDGKAEIIHCGYSGFKPFSSYSLTSSTGGLHYFKNNGGLAFTQISLSTLSYTACRFVDVDSDGDMDIVALRLGSIDTWINNGSGTFAAGPTSSVSTPPTGTTSDITIGKFNSDAIPDLAWGAGGVTYGGSVYVALGNGSGGFTISASQTASLGSFYGVNSVTAVKIDGDTVDDLVAGASYYSSPPAYFVRSLISNTGTFSGGWSASVTNGMYYSGTACVRAGNFLNNAPPCLVVSTVQDPPDSAGGVGGNDVSIFSGSSLSTKTTLSIPTGVTKNIGLGDFDFDGITDFAISAKICVAGGTSNPTGGTCDLVYFFKGANGSRLGSLNLQSGVPTVTFAQSGRVAAGDLDGDGRPDLLVSTSFWQTDNQQSTYYQQAQSSDGNLMGIVYYLNTSL